MKSLNLSQKSRTRISIRFLEGDLFTTEKSLIRESTAQ